MRTVWVLTPDDAVAHWMTAPFRYLAVPLRSQLGVHVRHMPSVSLASLPDQVLRADCDVVFVATPWQESVEHTVRAFQRIREGRPRTKIVYLDTFDQTGSPFFSILPYVDLYVKKQLLSPLSRYENTFHGGDLQADYYHREHGYDLGEWHFGSKLLMEYADRLTLGWNLGTAKHLVRGLAQSYLRRKTPWEKRDLDVHYRVGHTDEELSDWYSYHRDQWKRAMDRLGSGRRVVAAAGKSARVPMAQFTSEMRNTRLAMSPFGWGEVTDRDFLIVGNRSLLLKPDMSHLITEPNIYQPGVTYVPLKWDTSDLEERCEEFLDQPEKAERIARNARTAYRRWLTGGGFVRRIRDILQRLQDD